MEDEPLALGEQCFLHLVSHVMEYSPQELALLPVHHRHALLRAIAPVYFYCLEQTAVAKGIDTDAIWTEITELPRDSQTGYVANMSDRPIIILDSYKDGLGAQHLAYVWHFFLGQLGLNHNTRVKMTFATHTNMLKERTAQFLKSHNQPWFVPIVLNQDCQGYNLAPTHCTKMSEIEAAAHLTEIGALPRVLDLSIGSSVFWQQRKNGVLQQFLQMSQLRRVKLNFEWPETAIGHSILRTVTQSAVPTFKSLELSNLHMDSLSVLVPLFSGLEGYSGLKDLKAELHFKTQNLSAQYPLLASIVAHQTALESLDLSQLGQFPKDTEGERFILALTSLLGQPQFKTLRLCWCEGLPLAALQAIVEAFMSSSPQREQHLILISMNIVVLPRRQSLFQSRRYRSKPHLSASADHAAAHGSRKYLCFQYSCIPVTFLEWFRGIKYICLNTLEFIRCRTDTNTCTIREHFKHHPNFSVQHFECS